MHRSICLPRTVSPAAIARAMTQYRQADNMTDRMTALATLAFHDCPERNEALQDFYQRYESDPLIIDKWMGLQAMIPEPGTLDRVRTLTAHPAFSMNNPEPRACPDRLVRAWQCHAIQSRRRRRL